MKTLCVAIFLLFCVAGDAQAGFTAKELADNCAAAPGDWRFTVCASYVRGYMDAIDMGKDVPHLCLPDNVSVEGVLAAFRRFLGVAEKKDKEGSAADALFLTLLVTYPCADSPIYRNEKVPSKNTM